MPGPVHECWLLMLLVVIVMVAAVVLVVVFLPLTLTRGNVFILFLALCPAVRSVNTVSNIP